MTAAAFRTQLAAAARAAGLPFSVHPHMLRHACGFALAGEGQDARAIQAWLGHKDTRHAARYGAGAGGAAFATPDGEAGERRQEVASASSSTRTLWRNMAS